MEEPLKDVSDEELMALYQEGNSQAFTELFGRYEELLYNFFLRRLRDPGLCEDLYQKAFLNLHKARDRYDPELKFRPWFFTIAYNLYRDELKRLSAVREKLKGAVGSGQVLAEAAPESKALGLETSRKVREAVARLPELQREVIELSRFEGLSYAEIGRVTGRTENAVKQAAHRAFQSLREQLAPLFEEKS